MRLLAVRPDRVVFACVATLRGRRDGDAFADAALCFGGNGARRAWCILTRPLRAAEPLVLGLLSLRWPIALASAEGAGEGRGCRGGGDDLGATAASHVVPAVPATIAQLPTLLSLHPRAAALWPLQIERTLARHCAAHATESYKTKVRVSFFTVTSIRANPSHSSLTI